YQVWAETPAGRLRAQPRLVPLLAAGIRTAGWPRAGSVRRLAIDARRCGVRRHEGRCDPAATALMAHPVLDHAKVEDPEERGVSRRRVRRHKRAQRGQIEEALRAQLSLFKEPQHLSP